jgi:hypothetical protein
MDAHSRYLIACVPLLHPDAVHVRRAFERIFDEFGLPEAIRTDNGPAVRLADGRRAFPRPRPPPAAPDSE